MEIKLKELKLLNFKGVKDLTILFDEKQTDIFGANASGKTTIFDAFSWLLFGKDSQDRASFEIKTLQKNNLPINRLEHKVIGILSVDGMDKKLEKVYREKWVKKKGESEPEFSGHETEHFVDLVPVTKKDYESIVNGLISENVFKMITNPFYFANMKWQDKRQIVIGVAGEIDIKQVSNTNPEFQELLDQMEVRNIEDHLKVVASKKRKIKEELSHIPSRIDELNSSLSELQNDEIIAEMQEIDAKIQGIKAEIKEKTASGADKVTKIKELEAKIIALSKEKREYKAMVIEHEVQIVKEKVEREEKKSKELLKVSQDAAYSEEMITSLNRDLERLVNRRASLINEYKQTNALEFDISENDKVCSKCGQELPDIENTIEKMKAEFLERKTANMESIKKQGLELKDQIMALQTEIQKHEYFLGEHDKEKIIKELNRQRAAIDEMKQKMIDLLNSNVPTPEIDAKIEAAEKELDKFGDVDTSELEEALSAAQMERDVVVKKQRELENNDSILARIDEVKKEEKVMAGELAMLEKEEYLALQFNKTKMEMMEEHIKAKFGNVVFKMFNSLINGGEEPTCQILIDGVPFDNANRAAQINTGIKIINTLSDHYNVKAPIFVDNAEAVNELTATDSQLIRLVVVEPGFKVEGEIILGTIK
jgi:DNA repair exonuclease SbcCD ATPase subunit